MIEVTNLTKKYGDNVAVDHLSFRVEKGQIYGFLGPNGAGKSTTMNMITGYIAPTEGTVVIDGRDIQKEPEEARRRIGYLPEMPPLYMEMTVEEYLSFASQLKKIPRADQKARIEKGMEMTGILEVRGRLIRNLSKGYRQRVGLAQAVLGDPEVIILDEPSVGLDPKQIIEIRDLIRGLGKEHTVILSSHILSEVSAICDHIMIISHGHLVASDSPEGLRKLMSGSMELQLTVRGGKEELAEALAGLEGIASMESMTAPREDFARVKVVPRDNTDVREEIFYALAGARLPVMEMAVSEKSLEDIFLELTRDGEEEAQDGKGRKLLRGRRRKDDGSSRAAGSGVQEPGEAEVPDTDADAAGSRAQEHGPAADAVSPEGAGRRYGNPVSREMTEDTAGSTTQAPGKTEIPEEPDAKEEA